jgi:pyruvate dehydrogenase E2 component (dihydrolipoamide acetyltransferase)
MEAAEAWLAEENARRPPAERILPVVLLLKAVALATHDFPEMNGHYVDGTFHASEAVHLGLAVSLRAGGLVAPAVRDTDKRPVEDLSRAVMDLVQRARAGRLRSSEMTDATLTVSSLGDRGVETVFGIIYPPQVALVGFGRVTARPWAEDDLLGVRRAVTVTLSGDHRVSDGHRGGLFLQRIATLLQKPEAL